MRASRTSRRYSRLCTSGTPRGSTRVSPSGVTPSVRRHLLRALALHVRAEPDQLDETDSAQRATQHRFLEDALLRHRSEIADSDPERAVGSAIFLAACACRERILFSDSTHARAFARSDARLASDVTRMIAGYLLCPTPDIEDR